jgi:hypothetical protein
MLTDASVQLPAAGQATTQSNTVGGLIASVGFGFLPAFQDIETGETHLSINDDGSIAPIHMIDHVPAHWVVAFDEQGRATELKDGIMPGFVRGGRFFAHAELLHFPPLDA